MEWVEYNVVLPIYQIHTLTYHASTFSGYFKAGYKKISWLEKEKIEFFLPV